MMATRTLHIETLIKVTGRLIGVMNREVELLRSMDVAEIEAIQDEKQALTVAYEECVRAVAANPAVLEALEPPLRAELSDMAARFDAALAENARALQIVRDSHDRLLKAIVDAVSESRTQRKGYAADGSLAAIGRRKAGATISLTLDRQL
ncbi:MAG: hypothetical protein GEU92_20065 [Alphaproteobacteria bacterium]|nr:hypothetical protein [Alphaproteobacteria bacterium]